MIQDVFAVMWKESRELFTKRGLRSAIPLIVLPIVVLGIFLPWQMGNFVVKLAHYDDYVGVATCILGH